MQKLKQGTVVGDWSIDGPPLGAGGQSTVYPVRYTKTRFSAPAAMKLCTSRTPEAESRFAREIALLSDLKHPGIIGFRDSGRHNRRPFMVLERATVALDAIASMDAKAGVKLLQASPAVLLTFYRQICEAVAYLHAERALLHRDIKPHNILVIHEEREPLRAALADLGIAAAEDEQGQLTKTQETVGTPGYRAPEMSAAGRASPASDVYGLARVLEFIVTRRHPTALEPYPCPRGGLIDGSLADSLDEVIRRGCSWNPADRYPSAVEMLAALPQPILSCSASHRPLRGAGLEDADVRALGILIGLQEPSVYRFRRELGRISEYEKSMLLHRLKATGLAETYEEEDHNGNAYLSLRPTEAGVTWANENHSRVRELLANRASGTAARPDDFPPDDFGDDEIPF